MNTKTRHSNSKDNHGSKDLSMHKQQRVQYIVVASEIDSEINYGFIYAPQNVRPYHVTIQKTNHGNVNFLIPRLLMSFS